MPKNNSQKDSLKEQTLGRFNDQKKRAESQQSEGRRSVQNTRASAPQFAMHHDKANYHIGVEIGKLVKTMRGANPDHISARLFRIARMQYNRDNPRD